MRTQLISQFFSESLLVAMLAFGCSIVLVVLILPFFNQVSGKQITMPLYNIYFWLAGISFSIVTGLIAGTYPALYLSSFNPVKVLKGTFKAGRFAAMPRKVLVVVQFTVSIILIISTITVFRQVQFAKNRPAGYNSQGLIYVVMQTYNYHNNLNNIRNELMQAGAITDMAESNTPVTENDHYDNSFDWVGRDPQAATKFNSVAITTEFGKTVGWQFVDGRDFSKQFATDSNAVVMNETAVKYIGFKKTLGEMIKCGGKPYRIIGVIKDMVMESPYSLAKQTVFKLDSTIGGILNIKLSSNMSTSAALAKIAAVCKKYSPDEGFDYHFADEDYAQKFADEVRIGKLASFFAILAIFISCLGLFGMALFVAEQRTKEIGVRKVMGASVTDLWGLLSKEFVLLVFISLLIASPLAYYFMHNWLQNYEYRTGLSWWIFAVAAVGALLITLCTVSFQAIKAAVANPVKSLRAE
jgi:ABC-type antimicrobial peptide transport system permease subunit